MDNNSGCGSVPSSRPLSTNSNNLGNMGNDVPDGSRRSTSPSNHVNTIDDPQPQTSVDSSINRLSAVPSSGMVRNPTPNNSFCFDKEETRPKRSSSVGNAFRRLFSKSPAPLERSSSETHNSSESAKRRGARGHTPPRNVSSPNTSVESSTLPPNNSFSCNCVV